MEIKEIVDKLIGNCNPQGCSARDKDALINLIKKCNLIQELVFDVEDIAKNKNRYESSVKTIGEKANKFLNDLYEDKIYEKCEKVAHEMVNWALDNVNNKEANSGEQFDVIYNSVF